jgi:hypothetical protein
MKDGGNEIDGMRMTQIRRIIADVVLKIIRDDPQDLRHPHSIDTKTWNLFG